MVTGVGESGRVVVVAPDTKQFNKGLGARHGVAVEDKRSRLGGSGFGRLGALFGRDRVWSLVPLDGATGLNFRVAIGQGRVHRIRAVQQPKGGNNGQQNTRRHQGQLAFGRPAGAGPAAAVTDTTGHFFRGPLDVGAGYLVFALGIGAQQRTVADQVDQPGYTLAGAIQVFDRTGGKEVTAQACHAQPVLQVGRQFRLVDGIQVVTGGYPLVQLAQFRQGQDVLQFRLAQQHYLQQLFLGGFQVGQQAQLLQHFCGEVLGLVDNQYLVPAGGVGLEQVLVDGIHQDLDGRVGGVGNAQLVADSRQQLPGREPGVENQRNVDVFRCVLDKTAADRGFAGSYLAGNHDKTALPLHAIHQVRQGFLVAVTQVQVAGVRRNGERRFPKAKKIVVHVSSGPG